MIEGGPLARYRALVDGGELKPDPAQEAIAGKLQARHRALLRRPGRWIDRHRQRHRPVHGLYLHGRVGRGKTLLMDLFADSLNEAGVAVWRIHFHRFMDHVHAALGKRPRQRDPLPAIAAEISSRCRVLCFDEFHVSDIADAMLLGGLLTTLFARGLCVVATSNTAPRDLYADGLQRRRFIPAIEAIEKHCEVVHLEAATDYRLRELVRRQIYFHPLDERARSAMSERFAALTRGERIQTAPLALRGRSIEPLCRAGPVVWFDFQTLCAGARSSGDYIDLARRFDTLFVSDVPVMGERANDPARRFIHLVDECYDRSVKLIVSAEAAPQHLYTAAQLAAPFERTTSRLIEMQSREYLEREHRP